MSRISKIKKKISEKVHKNAENAGSDKSLNLNTPSSHSLNSYRKKMPLDKIVDSNLNYQQGLNYRPANTFDKYALLFLGAALIGMIMIGSSLTGYVVSESCCFPPGCAPENVCRVANINYPAMNASINREAQLSIVGFILLASSLFFFIGYARRHN